LVEHEPWLSYWLAASRVQFDPAAAQESFQRAFDAFTVRQDLAGALLAWSGVVDAIFYSYFDLSQVDLWIARLDRMQADGLVFPAPEIEAKVTFSMFVALAFRQPQHPRFDDWRHRLGAIAEAAPDPMFRLMARQYLLTSQIWSGDLCGASAALNELKREAGRRPTTPFLELVGALSEATLALYAGQVTDCFAAIDKALATAQGSGIHIWDKVLLGQGAALAFSHGETARGQAFAQRRAALARAGDMEERSLYHAIEAWSCWLAGRRAEALAQVKLCNQASQQMGLPHFTAVGSLAMAVVSFDCGDPDGALRQVEVGRSIGLSTRNPMLEWMADLLEAYMHLRRGEPATAGIERCMALGRQHGYRHFFFWPRSAVAVVCQAALAEGIQVEYVNELIDKGRLVAPPQAATSDHWPRPVKVYALGGFVVHVGGEPIRFEGKAQRAPMNLLKVIVAFGGHEVAESRIIDALWPDAEGGAGEQALATTLSRLRKLVGTNAVTRQAGHLGLDSAYCWVDCWALVKLIRGDESLDPLAFCDNIERLYGGRFLDGEPQAQWMLQLSERIHVGLVKALCHSGEAALRNRQPDVAARIYELGLRVDDLVEEFFAGLIRCHIASAQPSLAVATYHRCQRTLTKRLGVAPAEKTTRLYLSAIEGHSTWRP
jgi:DNA-binding SARP family transcriptional activator